MCKVSMGLLYADDTAHHHALPSKQVLLNLGMFVLQDLRAEGRCTSFLSDLTIAL